MYQLPGSALPLSRGYVTFEHFQRTGSLTHRWDNIGFDGPAHPTPRAVDAPDSLIVGRPGGINLGYTLSSPTGGPPVTLSLGAIDLTGARSANLSLSLSNFDQSRTLRYCFNLPKNECHELRSPFPPSQIQDVPIVIDGIDLTELQPGGNQIGDMRITTQTTG